MPSILGLQPEYIQTTLSDAAKLSETILAKYPESGVMYSGFYRASNGEVKKQTYFATGFVTNNAVDEITKEKLFITSIDITHYTAIDPRPIVTLIQNNTTILYWEGGAAPAPLHVTQHYEFNTPLQAGRNCTIQGTAVCLVLIRGFTEE